MQNIAIANTELQTSRLIYGCMRLAGDGSTAAKQKGLSALAAAVEAGYTHFDHADIYGAGECEALFGQFLSERPELREKLLITSKAGIRIANNDEQVQRYDFSKNYIKNQVDASLSRLNCDYLDLFLLHRPDYLMNINEVADTFAELHQSGKVCYFGVSNFSPSQLSMLQSACDMPLVVNQVEINIHNISAFTDGTLDQCQSHHITPIAWCPLATIVYDAWGNTFSETQTQRILAEVNQQAAKYGVNHWQLILAWLLKHPANICPIIGTTTPTRINDSLVSLSVDYQHNDWYRLLEARNGVRVP